MSTTNGTRAIVTAAERCERVYIASLLNLAAVTEAARAHGDDVAVFCAGVKGAFALDDAYVAGRVADGLGFEPSDAAEAARRLAASYGSAEEAFRASRSGRNLINHGPELEADIPWCARESVLDVVPRLVGMHGIAAEITSDHAPGCAGQTRLGGLAELASSTVRVSPSLYGPVSAPATAARRSRAAPRASRAARAARCRPGRARRRTT